MALSTDYLRTDPTMEQRLLEYIEATCSASESWWREGYPGTTENRLTRLDRLRLRYEARRSVAALLTDAKTQPFRRASNVGVGLEQIMGEWLIANSLANTVDLDPPVDAFDLATGKTDALTQAFYREQYLRAIRARDVYETLLREVFSVGTAVSKWESWSERKTIEESAWVLFDPGTRQPLFRPSPETGEPVPIEADPETALEDLPLTPLGQRVQVGRLTGVREVATGWRPRLRVRTVEQIKAPPTATNPRPDEWDYLHEEYTVNAWWFLSRQGEMHEGRIPKERLALLWQRLGVTPEEAWRRPNGQLVRPVRVRESHLKFPATRAGRPVELIVLSLPEHKFLLTWRLSRFPTRPFFIHQVWHRTNHWMGKGIPETLIGLRNAMDALLNQDLDAGNIYNQPPLLISSLAGVNDETFEMAGPGAVWYLRDINGMKFLPPPIRSRDPLELLNWLLSMGQRLWGVSDLNLSAPTQSLSPNVNTATGVVSVLNQGTVKFSHFIRNIEAVRSEELALLHELYRTLWMGQEIVADEQGNPTTFTKDMLRATIRLRAPGEGMLSNPLFRQQRLQELMATHASLKNPIVLGDPEVMLEATKQLNAAAGVTLPVKPPTALEEMQLASALLKTPTGQRAIPTAMQELQAAMALEMSQRPEKTNGTPELARV